MASYEIPESIIGVPLFVPDGNDFFEVVAGGMPNGDASLRVRGDISADYKAYQPAPVTTPSLTANGTAWSLNLWIKAPATGGTATDSGTSATLYNSCILSMMKATNATNGLNINGLWSFSASTTNGAVMFSRGTSGGSSSTILTVTGAAIRDSTWHMVTVMTAQGNPSLPAQILKDDGLTALATDTVGTGVTEYPDMFLCIGKYSDLAGPTAFAADYQLGKISFHDHQLTATERQLLYNTMVG